MWPIALPQTKVVHLLRLAWATVVVNINQSETSQGNAVIQSGCKSQLYHAYHAYRLHIQSESKANTSKGWI
jgi:sulfur transfer protein SufE